MTVKELIEALLEMPQDARIILQKDSEGNGYSPLYAVDGECVYTEESNWAGSVLSTWWSHEEACFDSAEEWEDFKKASERVVVLAPVN